MSDPEWTPFDLAEPIPLSDEALQPIADLAKVSLERARELVALQVADQTVLINSRYQVAMSEGPSSKAFGHTTHLSIKRLDRQPIHDWRDLQRIKNELMGEEYEAIELYPAESRLVDTSNQYHLWVLNNPKKRVPVGFKGPRAVFTESIGQAVQRPYERKKK